VVILTDANFDELVVDPTDMTARGKWFLKMYAPWCGHCKKLTPVWDELSHVNEKNNVQVGKVDCTVHADTCARFDVKGYPTLVFLDGEDWYKYRGMRDIDNLATFSHTYKEHADTTGRIEAKLEGMDKYKKMGSQIADEFGYSVDVLFNKIGMGHIDKTIQISIAGLLFTLPMVLLCVLLCCCNDDPVPVPKAPAASAKPESGKKNREKLD
jgi:protein disulfide-isomerase-like protein